MSTPISIHKFEIAPIAERALDLKNRNRFKGQDGFDNFRRELSVEVYEKAIQLSEFIVANHGVPDAGQPCAIDIGKNFIAEITLNRTRKGFIPSINAPGFENHGFNIDASRAVSEPANALAWGLTNVICTVFAKQLVKQS